MGKRVRFILEGNLATREEITVQESGGSQQTVVTSQTKPLEAVMAELEKQNPHIDFAPGLQFGRWVASISKGNKTAVAVELPPGMRDFHYRNASPGSYYNETPGQIFHIAFPYVFLVVVVNGNSLERVLVYYRDAPLTTTDGELFQSTLPNIYTDGGGKWNEQLCTGSWGIPVNLVLVEKINLIVEQFLAAEYNTDLRGNRWDPASGFNKDGRATGKPQTVPDHPDTFEEWQKRSAEDPNFVLKLNWVSASVTLEQILRKGVE